MNNILACYCTLIYVHNSYRIASYKPIRISYHIHSPFGILFHASNHFVQRILCACVCAFGMAPVGVKLWQFLHFLCFHFFLLFHQPHTTSSFLCFVNIIHHQHIIIILHHDFIHFNPIFMMIGFFLHLFSVGWLFVFGKYSFLFKCEHCSQRINDIRILVCWTARFRDKQTFFSYKKTIFELIFYSFFVEPIMWDLGLTFIKISSSSHNRRKISFNFSIRILWLQIVSEQIRVHRILCKCNLKSQLIY